MPIEDTHEFITELERNGELKRVKTEVDSDLEIAEILRREMYSNGSAILFENVKGSKYKAVSNLFGTLDRSKFMFRDSLEIVKQLIELKTNPISSLKNPAKALFTILNGILQFQRK